MAAIHRLDVFRRFHDEICNILDADSSTLSSFAGKLYSKELVGMKTKREVLGIQGYQGADILLDHVMMKLKSDTQRYETVLEIIGEEEALSDVRAKMVALQTTSSDTNMIRKGPPTCTDSINDAESCARRLRNLFEELVITINTAIITTDISNLRLRIDVLFSSECPGQYTTDNDGILCKLDACSTAEGILRCLIRYNFIEYLNYKLLEVFVKASGSDPSLKKSVEAYEQEYLMLFKCDFHSIIRLFHNPILAAVIPAFSLPDFSIRLGTKLEKSSVYELKELFQNRFPWAEHLVILDVTKNCVLIKYGVLPFFISAVVRDLTDPTVIEELKREDITIELSPELMKYSITSLPEQLQIPPSSVLEHEISSSDVVQSPRTHDVAITDRQKAQLQQQRRLTSVVTEVTSDDRQSLEAIAEGLKGVDIESAEKELQGINWPSLLNALGIDRNTETRLFEAHMGDRTGAAMREMLRHWIDNYDYSWDILARALMSIWSYRRNGAYLYNKYVNPECFTPEIISKELSFIEDWFELAHPFFLNSEKLREAVKDAKSDDEKRLGAITAWYNTYETPSWEEIACVLEEIHPDHVETAKQLRKKYLPTVSLQPSRNNDLAKLEELNEKNAFEEISDVQDWYALGWFLGIPENELMAIEEAKTKINERRLEVLNLWLQSEGDKASWLKLGQAVCKIHSNLGMGKKLVKRARIKEDVKISDQFPESIKTHNTTKLDLTAANAAKEIAGIPWKVLSTALGLDHSPVDSLETQHCDYAGNNEFVEMVLEYWVEHFNASWEVLAVTMLQLPQLRTTGAYLYNKYVNPDSFTIDKVVGVLSSFDNWLQLFYSLFDDAVVFRKVIKAIQVVPNIHGVTDYWMRYGDRPSWEKVATAIDLYASQRKLIWLRD